MSSLLSFFRTLQHRKVLESRVYRNMILGKLLSLQRPSIHCLLLNLGATAKSPWDSDEARPKSTHTGKGCHILPIISNLLSSAENWYPIASSKDYHFPGEFEHPYPQCLGYCSDFTALADYDPDQPDFLCYDIQLAKGTARS